MYNLFRLTAGRRQPYVRELFDEPGAQLYQVPGLLEAPIARATRARASTASPWCGNRHGDRAVILAASARRPPRSWRRCSVCDSLRAGAGQTDWARTREDAGLRRAGQ
jgi:hypothetical protein